jgi:tRNA (guanine26-N2/guanine27-N2)-dimethyltransferase
MYKIIRESKAKIKVPEEKKVSKKLPVFYNPVMKLNRDISILLLNSIENKNMQIALPLAGTGVRGVRFLLELKKNKIKNISFNDLNKEAVKIINQNLKLNKLKSNKIQIKNQDSNLFLLNSTGFDYIDVDPFGTPNPFLDAAVKRISRDGILAVTATDTSALAGTFPNACRRKYWAIPLRNETKHENGIRILIRKIQLIGAQFNKALIPIFSYSIEHYYRIFFKVEKGKQKTDKILKKHGIYEQAGPMWLGILWDTGLINNMVKNCKEELVLRFLKIIKQESKIKTVGFYDIHRFCKKYKLKIPKKQILIKLIRKAGYKAAETSFTPEGIRSDINKKNLIKVLKTLQAAL